MAWSYVTRRRRGGGGGGGRRNHVGSTASPWVVGREAVRRPSPRYFRRAAPGLLG